VHVEKFFARYLGGLIRDRQGTPARLIRQKSRTMSMHADEESDEGIVPMKRSNNEDVSSAETGEGRTSPVQQAVATVLEAIYEEDFLGFSYGFRPGRVDVDPFQTTTSTWAFAVF
jgi:hypothetical protein